MVRTVLVCFGRRKEGKDGMAGNGCIGRGQIRLMARQGLRGLLKAGNLVQWSFLPCGLESLIDSG